MYDVFIGRPRRVAPTSSPSFPRGKSRSSKRLSVSWMLTKMVSCPPLTSLLPSAPLANPSLTARPKACSQKPPDPSTSLKWSCFSPRKWPAVSRGCEIFSQVPLSNLAHLQVLMTTTPSPRLLMHSKSTAKSTPKCSNTLS